MGSVQAASRVGDLVAAPRPQDEGYFVEEAGVHVELAHGSTACPLKNTASRTGAGQIRSGAGQAHEVSRGEAFDHDVVRYVDQLTIGTGCVLEDQREGLVERETSLPHDGALGVLDLDPGADAGVELRTVNPRFPQRSFLHQADRGNVGQGARGEQVAGRASPWTTAQGTR